MTIHDEPTKTSPVYEAGWRAGPKDTRKTLQEDKCCISRRGSEDMTGQQAHHHLTEETSLWNIISKENVVSF